MTSITRILLNNVTFRLEQTPVAFARINLPFADAKYGIVGKNGVGKTTLMRLLSGDLTPDSGSIQRFGTIITVPQSHDEFGEQATVSDVLGVTDILAALNRISHGSIDEHDYELASNQWNIEQRIEDTLTQFGLWPISLNTPFSQLSGGQKTKVLLAKTMIFPADFLLFDEPTNNLDKTARDVLYNYIDNATKGMAIISHDRTLLNRLDCIIEINNLGIDTYGGNYDFYCEQKQLKQQAIAHEIQARSESLAKTKQTTQTRMERHQQNEARGRKEKRAQISAKGRYDKIAIKSKKGRSENTNRRIRTQADKQLQNAQHLLADAKAKREVDEAIAIDLAATHVPTSKIVLKIETLCFQYPASEPLLRDFELQIIGPERVAISGPNGCGKSTLIKLIRKERLPQRGKIHCGVEVSAYLDQTVSFLNPMKTIVENFLVLNPECTPNDAYATLAAFKFRNKDAEKRSDTLSGGERMRAGLAITLMAKHPPQLIILDEPTNHLDIASIRAIESALSNYQGAILAVSHDEVFLQNIGITRTIYMNEA